MRNCIEGHSNRKVENHYNRSSRIGTSVKIVIVLHWLPTPHSQQLLLGVSRWIMASWASHSSNLFCFIFYNKIYSVFLSHHIYIGMKSKTPQSLHIKNSNQHRCFPWTNRGAGSHTEWRTPAKVSLPIIKVSMPSWVFYIFSVINRANHQC